MVLIIAAKIHILINLLSVFSDVFRNFLYNIIVRVRVDEHVMSTLNVFLNIIVGTTHMHF